MQWRRRLLRRAGLPWTRASAEGVIKELGLEADPLVAAVARASRGDARRGQMLVAAAVCAYRCEHAPGVGGGGPRKSWDLMSAESPLSLIGCQRASLLARASRAMPPPGLVQAELDVG